MKQGARLIICGLLAVLPQAVMAFDQTEILLWDTTINVGASSDLVVEERFDYDFKDDVLDSLDHTIALTPVPESSSRFKVRHIDYEIIEVLRDGTALSFETETLANGLQVHVDAGDTPFTATSTVLFRYRVTGGIQYLKGAGSELTWTSQSPEDGPFIYKVQVQIDGDPELFNAGRICFLNKVGVHETCRSTSTGDHYITYIASSFQPGDAMMVTQSLTKKVSIVRHEKISLVVWIWGSIVVLLWMLVWFVPHRKEEEGPTFVDEAVGPEQNE